MIESALINLEASYQKKFGQISRIRQCLGKVKLMVDLQSKAVSADPTLMKLMRLQVNKKELWLNELQNQIKQQRAQDQSGLLEYIKNLQKKTQKLSFWQCEIDSDQLDWLSKEVQRKAFLARPYVRRVAGQLRLVSYPDLFNPQKAAASALSDLDSVVVGGWDGSMLLEGSRFELENYPITQVRQKDKFVVIRRLDRKVNAYFLAPQPAQLWTKDGVKSVGIMGGNSLFLKVLMITDSAILVYDWMGRTLATLSYEADNLAICKERILVRLFSGKLIILDKLFNQVGQLDSQMEGEISNLTFSQELIAIKSFQGEIRIFSSKQNSFRFLQEKWVDGGLQMASVANTILYGGEDVLWCQSWSGQHFSQIWRIEVRGRVDQISTNGRIAIIDQEAWIIDDEAQKPGDQPQSVDRQYLMLLQPEQQGAFPFEKVALLGKGSFGQVWSVKKQERMIAVKIQLTSNVKNMLKVQYQVMNQLKGGEGIPAVFSYNENRDSRWIEMQLLDSSVQQISVGLSSVQAARLLEKLIKILQGVHRTGYIHRDVKPSNLMISKERPSRIFLIDFGLAKKYRDQEGIHIKFKEGKKLIGTAVFASPSVLQGHESSRRDDIISAIFAVLHLIKPLPWSKLCMEQIKKMKEQIEVQELFEGLPFQFKRVYMQALSTPFEGQPEYLSYRDELNSLEGTWPNWWIKEPPKNAKRNSNIKFEFVKR